MSHHVTLADDLSSDKVLIPKKAVTAPGHRVAALDDVAGCSGLPNGYDLRGCVWLVT